MMKLIELKDYYTGDKVLVNISQINIIRLMDDSCCKIFFSNDKTISVSNSYNYVKRQLAKENQNG